MTEAHAPQPSVAPTTTAQQDITTAGQRTINLIWEGTQAIISILVVATNMIVGAWHAIMNTPGEYPIVLSGSLFLVVGFYFSRTNHENVGGVGFKPENRR